jgi:eukaryotic translation initiation factor 2C
VTLKFLFNNFLSFSYKRPVHGDNISNALQCLEIVQKSRFRNTNAVQFGRQFYFPPIGNHVDLTAGMELWRGLHQSIVLGTKSIYLNADVLSKAVPAEAFVDELFQRTFRNDNFALMNHLKGLKISYKAGNSEQFKLFQGLGKPPKQQTFLLDGKTVSVEKYFLDKFKIRLRSPTLPTVQLQPREKNIFIPMELCKVPGGQMNQKICPDSCKQQMIRHTAVSTDERKANIKQFSTMYAENKDLKAFGIDVKQEFEKVMARIIAPPDVKYNNRTEKVNSLKGTWKDGNYLQKAVGEVKFAIVNCDDRTSPQTLLNFKVEVNKKARNQGLQLQDSQGAENIIRVNVSQNFNDLQTIFNQCKDQSFGLVFVILSKEKECYAKIKTIAETQVGILTQCLMPNTVSKINPSTLDNIFLKLNAKLGGVNRDVIETSYNKLMSGNSIMFVGGDVTHPSPEQRETSPSVVGVCASYDPAAFKYHSVWRLQKGGMDRIEDFESIMHEQLRFFASKNGKVLPKKIVYYRDGVAESQLQTFVQPEIEAMKRAFQRNYPQGSMPQLNVIVVNKRHHMRAFPLTKKDPQNPKDFNNILPGTIIDRDIVSPYHFQFFLASHSPFQGTTKPTKYTVFLNECKIGPDDMEMLSFCLCHMYARCNRSVSYPNCTYNAHLMAARAKCYITGDELTQNLAEEYKKRQLKSEIVHSLPMFFV